MAYSEYAVASYEDILARVVDFGTPLGYVQQSADNSIVVSLGGETVPVVITVRSTVEMDLRAVNDSLIASVFSPRLSIAPATSGSPNPTDSQPTRLFMCSALDSGVPYLAGIIEYGFNNVRHFYIGGMVKVGTYGGGTAIDTSGFHRSTVHNYTPRDIFGGASEGSYLKPLFTVQANTATMPNNRRGGVVLNSPGIPDIVWSRTFGGVNNNDQSPIGWSRRAAAIDAVIGGFGDGFNDFYVSDGSNPAESFAALIPINLFIPRTVGVSAVMHPIGHPAGLRMFNMAASQPYSEFLVGATDWRGFPACRRNVSPKVSGWPGQSIFSHPKEENSFLLGYAYKVN